MKSVLSEENNRFELKRKIGIWSAVALQTGIMVGSGIFVSPSGVLQGVDGNVGLSLVLWAACGLLALLAALCYAELGTRISESGADFAYHGVTYGKPLGFLYAWTSMMIVLPTGAAAMALTFGLYLVKAFYSENCNPSDSTVKLAASVLLIMLVAINCRSVSVSTKIQIFFTSSKFIAMVIIIIAGLVQLGERNPIAMSNFHRAFDSNGVYDITLSQISLAFYHGLFSYDGWSNLNYVTEEIKESHKTLPRAISIAVPLVTGFYVLMNVAYLSVLTPEEMINSPAVAISFGDRVLGSFSWIIPVTVCMSTAGSLNGAYLSGGRMAFVAARAGQWPSIFKMVHVKYYTPIPSIAFNTSMTLLFMIPSDFDTMLYAFSFTAWTFYGLSAAAVIVLRLTRKDLPMPYKVPIIVPMIVTLAALYLVITPIVNSPDLIYLYAVIFVLFGLLPYFLLIHKNYTLPGIDTVTRYGQMIFKAAPTDCDED